MNANTTDGEEEGGRTDIAVLQGGEAEAVGVGLEGARRFATTKVGAHRQTSKP